MPRSKPAAERIIELFMELSTHEAQTLHTMLGVLVRKSTATSTPARTRSARSQPAAAGAQGLGTRGLGTRGPQVVPGPVSSSDMAEGAAEPAQPPTPRAPRQSAADKRLARLKEQKARGNAATSTAEAAAREVSPDDPGLAPAEYVDVPLPVGE